MFCVKCGRELPEGVAACPDCGAKVEKEINLSDVTSYAGQKAQQMSDSIQSQVNNFQQSQKEAAESRKIKDVRDLFVNEEEQQKAVLGGGYLSNLLHSGVLQKGFGVLTDRRLYYRGKCFYKVGGRYMKADEDCTLDLQDITSTGFFYTRNLICLLMSALSCIASWYCLIFCISEFYLLAAFLLCIFVALTVLFFIVSKRTMYEVTFAGGTLSIKASSYGVPQLRAFDKELHRAKDEFLFGKQ